VNSGCLSKEPTAVNETGATLRQRRVLAVCIQVVSRFADNFASIRSVDMSLNATFHFCKGGTTTVVTKRVVTSSASYE